MRPARRKALALAGIGAGAAAVGALVGALVRQSSSGAAALLSATFPDLDGRPRRLLDWQGRPLVCNFWATWCAPCREEMPSMERLRARMQGRKFVLLAVNVGEGARAARAFGEKMGLGFPLLLDGDTKTARAWSARVLPASFVMGFSFPVVQKAVQQDMAVLGQRVGLVQLANILGNSAGSLVAGLALLHWLGTAGTLRVLAAIGLAFALVALFGAASRLSRLRTAALAVGLAAAIIVLPAGPVLWRGLHGVDAAERSVVSEDRTGIVLLPERTFAFAMAKFPAPEVATTTTALLLLLSLAAPALAQTAGDTVSLSPKDPLEKRLHAEIVCTCGCRRALGTGSKESFS